MTVFFMIRYPSDETMVHMVRAKRIEIPRLAREARQGEISPMSAWIFLAKGALHGSCGLILMEGGIPRSIQRMFPFFVQEV
jgi:hypothetical protein